MNFDQLLETLFSSYISDPKWYPFILIGIALIVLIIIYFLFAYIRSFIAWIFGVSEVAKLQKEQNALLRELLALAQERNDMIYEKLYLAPEPPKEEKTEIIQHEITQTKEQKPDQYHHAPHQRKKKKRYFSKPKNNPE